MPEPARLLLCADDYGLSPGVDAAITGLVRAGRLGAFSCLSNGPAWFEDAGAVADLRAQAQAGLHFNLTEGRPLSPSLAALWPSLPSLPRLLLAAHLGRLPLAAPRTTPRPLSAWAEYAHALILANEFTFVN